MEKHNHVYVYNLEISNNFYKFMVKLKPPSSQSVLSIN